ncbi:MAG: hypothetical protein GKS05_09565 [Nitrospirales bacterium]|nr:hypothetical protein [Nitrospirales bacterium]
MKTLHVSLGARIPKSLKSKLDRFCLEHGMKMSFVVAAALKDKLGKLEEELEDRLLGRERLADAEFLAQDSYAKYLKRRRADR